MWAHIWIIFQSDNDVNIIPWEIPYTVLVYTVWVNQTWWRHTTTTFNIYHNIVRPHKVQTRLAYYYIGHTNTAYKMQTQP